MTTTNSIGNYTKVGHYTIEPNEMIYQIRIRLIKSKYLFNFQFFSFSLVYHVKTRCVSNHK